MSRIIHPFPKGATRQPRASRRSVTFTLAATGELLAEGVDPADVTALMGRYWELHGRGAVHVTYRRMRRGEAYKEVIDG